MNRTPQPRNWQWWRPLGALCLGVLTLCAAIRPEPAAGQSIDTAALNRDPAVREAFDHFYGLDYDGALAAFQRIQAAHPDDPLAVDYVLNATLFRELYRQDLLDTTLYAHDGFLSSKHPVAEDKAVTAAINDLTDKAVGLANDRLKKNPRDIDALFARAWAESLDAVDIALIQHSFVSSLRHALQARSDDDKVLAQDPSYVDAELVVGIHQYVVGSLPFGFKLMAGLAGIHGDKKKGMAMLADDGQRGVITSVEARTALMLFLRRDGQYAEAAGMAAALSKQYPHNFLFRLEQANLQKDAGDGPEAIALYRALLLDARRGAFPNAHLELAWFGLGETLRGQKDHAGAAQAFAQVLVQPHAGPELQRRADLALGEEYDALRERGKAVAEYQHLMTSSPGSPEAEQARVNLQGPSRAW